MESRDGLGLQYIGTVLGFSKIRFSLLRDMLKFTFERGIQINMLQILDLLSFVYTGINT